jgi:HEAT repeat protein
LGQPSGWAEILLSAFEDDNPDVRAAAIKQQWTVKWKRRGMRPDYFRLIEDDNSIVRKAALSSLCSVYYENPPDEAVAAAAKAITDSDPGIRFTAASALASWGVHIEQAVQVLTESLQYPLYREPAIHVLERIGPAADAAAPYLARIVKAEDTGPRMEDVVRSLGTQDDWAQVLREKKPGTILLAEIETQKPDWIEFVKQPDRDYYYVLFQWDNGREEKIYHWDQEKYIRSWAVEALAEISKDLEIIDLFFETLNDDDPLVRGAAAMGLANAIPTSEDAVKKIIGMLLNDGDEIARYRAASALGEMGAAQADITVPALISAFDDESSTVRIVAVEALCQIGPPAKSAIPILNEILDTYDPEKNLYDRLQKDAAEALISIGPESGDRKPFLIDMLKHKNPEVRQCALYAIVKITGKDSLPYLVDALRDDDKFVKLEAVYRLGDLGEKGEDVVKYLLEALNDEDPFIGDTAAYRIRDLGPAAKGALDGLITFLESPDAVVNFRDSLDQLRYMDKQGRTHACLAALEVIGPDAGKAVPVLTRLLKARDSELVADVLDILPQLGDAAVEAVPQMIDLLSDRKAEIREAAAYTLGKLGPAAGDAVPQLKALLSDKSPGIRCKAATALGLIGARAATAIPTLEKLAMSDKNRIVRRAAQEALEKLTANV